MAFLRGIIANLQEPETNEQLDLSPEVQKQSAIVQEAVLAWQANAVADCEANVSEIRLWHSRSRFYDLYQRLLEEHKDSRSPLRKQLEANASTFARSYRKAL